LPIPWLEGYNDNKEEFYLLVLIAALGGFCWRTPTIWRPCSSVSSYLFTAVRADWLRFPSEALAGSQYQVHHSVCRVLFPAVRYCAGYAQSGNLSFVALGKSIGDGAA
jgi:NADH-quinone oxidoreductase subunit N